MRSHRAANKVGIVTFMSPTAVCGLVCWCLSGSALAAVLVAPLGGGRVGGGARAERLEGRLDGLFDLGLDDLLDHLLAQRRDGQRRGVGAGAGTHLDLDELGERIGAEVVHSHVVDQHLAVLGHVGDGELDGRVLQRVGLDFVEGLHLRHRDPHVDGAEGDHRADHDDGRGQEAVEEEKMVEQAHAEAADATHEPGKLGRVAHRGEDAQLMGLGVSVALTDDQDGDERVDTGEEQEDGPHQRKGGEDVIVDLGVVGAAPLDAAGVVGHIVPIEVEEGQLVRQHHREKECREQAKVRLLLNCAGHGTLACIAQVEVLQGDRRHARSDERHLLPRALDLRGGDDTGAHDLPLLELLN
mmetsp:Transcript_7629/g.18164  ORF Transcript_7629/g.18164 Transcript_7629/m.18164 type:complete len:355 (+) Transcript_7629:276-1340(+)